MDRARLQCAPEPRVLRNPAKSRDPQFPIRRIPAYLVRRLHLICTAMVAEAVEGEGLTMLQWAVLVHIHATPDIDQSRLAATASTEQTNTGRRRRHVGTKG